MVNDTTTLNGALMQLGETLATNLTAKRVTANASDGLTTLSTKINNIESNYDLILRDDAVTGKVNSNAFSYNNVLTLTTDANGTQVFNDATGEGRVYSAIRPTMTYTDWDSPFTIVFDVVSGSDTVRIQVLQDTTSNYVSKTLTELGNPSHIRIDYDGNTLNYFTNHNTIPYFSQRIRLTNPLQIRFYLPNNTSIKYKNYRIYQKKNNPVYSVNPFQYNSEYINVTTVNNDYWYYVASKTASGTDRMLMLKDIELAPFNDDTTVRMSFVVPQVPTTSGQYGFALTNKYATTLYNLTYYRKSSFKWGTGANDVAQELQINDVITYEVHNTTLTVKINGSSVYTRTIDTNLTRTGFFKICFYSASTGYSGYIKDIKYEIIQV